MNYPFVLNIPQDKMDDFIKTVMDTGVWSFNFDNYFISDVVEGFQYRQKIFWFEAPLEKSEFVCIYNPPENGFRDSYHIIRPTVPLSLNISANIIFRKINEIR